MTYEEITHDDCETCGRSDANCDCVMCGSCCEIVRNSRDYDFDLDMCRDCRQAEGWLV